MILISKNVRQLDLNIQLQSLGDQKMAYLILTCSEIWTPRVLVRYCRAINLSLTPASVRAQSRRATMAYGSTGYTWLTTFLAEALNTWKENGVDLKAVDFPTGRDAMQALLAGSAEFSTTTETPLIFAAMRGLRPIILINYSRYSRV